MTHHQPIQDTIRVIGDQNNGSLAGNIGQRTTNDIKAKTIAIDHHLPKITPLRDFIFIPFCPFDQAQSARRVLKQPHHCSATARFNGMRITYLAGNFACVQ